MKTRRNLLILLALAALAIVSLLFWARHELGPGSQTTETLVRYERETPLPAILGDLQKRGVVRNAGVLGLYARWTKDAGPVEVGTYRFAPGLSGEGVLAALRKPLRQMVRLPETNWALRSAHILEERQVCTADEYMALVRDPKVFQRYVPFALPKDTLEGYLYPDTYDLPPLLGAKQTILRQLRNFEKRVWDGLGHPNHLQRSVIVASIVQMEVAKKDELPKVAGVVENRLRKGMRLQIDATVNYALQKWRPLSLADLKDTDSPYNTYRYDGLPPGPICSPTVDSIKAAMHPAEHHYLYYVADPTTHYHMFASTWEAHKHNIAIRKKHLKEAGA